MPERAGENRIASAAETIRTISDTDIRPSVIHGNGVFTTVPRRSHQVLTVLDGQAVSVATHPDVLWRLEWNALSTSELLVRAIRTTYGYVNHSPAPNVAIDPDGRTIRANRDIAMGEELTLDYRAQPLPPVYLADARAAYLRENA